MRRQARENIRQLLYCTSPHLFALDTLKGCMSHTRLIAFVLSLSITPEVVVAHVWAHDTCSCIVLTLSISTM
jgi:hypothetical protein